MGLLGAAMVVLGVGLYARAVLACARPSPDAAPTCALVVDHVIFSTRKPVGASPWYVSVKVASLNSDDGERPYLAIQPEHGTIQWYDLGSRNEAIVAAFAAYLASRAPRFEAPLATEWIVAAMLVPLGLLLAAIVPLRERLQRFTVDLDTGELRVSARRLLRTAEEAQWSLDAVTAVETEQVGEDGDLCAIVLRLGKRRARAGEAMSAEASRVARALDAEAKEWRKRRRDEKRA